jgi:hypothetical protein
MSRSAPARPDYCTDAHLVFLDSVRDSGVINMFGGTEPLREVYPELERKQAQAVLMYWMATYSDRHPE